MQISLEFNDLHQAAQQFSEQCDGVCQSVNQATTLLIPEQFGQGTLRCIQVREGLTLLTHHYQLNCDLRLDFQQFSCQNGLVNLSFCLAGQYSGAMPGFKNDLEMAMGQMGLATVPDVAGTVNLTQDKNIRVVELVMAPELVIALVGDSFKAMPTTWQQPLKALASYPFYQSTKFSPDISQVLQDLLYCPYEGALRQLYLEGKSLELLALYFAHVSESARPQAYRLTRKDLDGLHHAQYILFEKMENPPSLAALSKQVGLSERRLQQGFQQYFGTTVFGALHEYRMEQARQLLDHGKMSVGAIAHTVGISHRGYFAAAFKRRFGITPSEHLKRIVQ